MNMETKVEKYRKNFLVTTIEDMCIKVSKAQVEHIAESVPDVEEKEVAILLATIKQARIMYSRNGNAYKKVEQEKETVAIIKLLQSYDIDMLSSIFEEMKYYEIKKVLENQNPIEALRKLI